jgi:hypothetical protein
LDLRGTSTGGGTGVILLLLLRDGVLLLDASTFDVDGWLSCCPLATFVVIEGALDLLRVVPASGAMVAALDVARDRPRGITGVAGVPAVMHLTRASVQDWHDMRGSFVLTAYRVMHCTSFLVHRLQMLFYEMLEINKRMSDDNTYRARKPVDR